MSDSTEPSVDLPPLPPVDHDRARHESHSCGGSAGPQHKCHGKGRFLLGCMTGCLISIVVPVVILSLLVWAGCHTASSAFKDAGIASKLDKTIGGSSADAFAGVDEYPDFDEIWSCGDEDGAKVVRIAINGEISLDEPHWKKYSDSAAAALKMIKRATLDEDVQGIILEIDSPGGGITASDIIWKALLDFKESEKDRAVVVIMGDLCASGGYYISAAADRIVAHPTTLTGSIGVIITSFNIRELAEKIGIKDVSIASGENKQMLSPFKDITDEQRAMLKSAVDALHSRFVTIVADGRKLPEEKVREIADGRVILATEALKLGLVDKIGYFSDSYDCMCDLLDKESLYVIRYEHKESFFDLFDGNDIFGLSSYLRRISNSAHAKLKYEF